MVLIQKIFVFEAELIELTWSTLQFVSFKDTGIKNVILM